MKIFNQWIKKTGWLWVIVVLLSLPLSACGKKSSLEEVPGTQKRSYPAPQ